MNWLFFLHFYQPASQQADILEAIVKQSYEPIFSKLSSINNPITMNITGALLSQLDKHGYYNLIDDIKDAVSKGKVELTGSCMYHAVAPLIPLDEVTRQVKLNQDALKFYFGNDLATHGFFPPEMAYKPELSPLLSELGFKWVIIDEIANPINNSETAVKEIYQAKGTDLKLFFRNRRVSNEIMSAVARDTNDLKESLRKEFNEEGYFVTGMDGETFGHHRVGFDSFLFSMLQDEALGITSISKYIDECAVKYPTKDVVTVPSTWATSSQDILEGIQFMSWDDKTNDIHKYQREFFNHALTLLNNNKENSPQYEEARKKMDVAIASDHYWWASAKPWWSVEMIEDGAFKILEVVRNTPHVTSEDISKAHELYQKIISTAFLWQRSGKIRQMAIQQNEFQRIPFKERTLEKGGHQEAVYWGFIDTLKKFEKKASEEGKYEKAILWRDAVYKLDTKLDVYDTINGIDMLRQDIGNEEMEKILDKYSEEFKRIKGGQPEQRGR